MAGVGVYLHLKKDELIYYLDTSRALDCLICKNLNDVAGKERLRMLRNIESYFFSDNEVVALRDMEDKHVIIKWGEDGSEQVLLVFGVDVIELYDAQLCGYYERKYIFFSKFSKGGIYTVDGSSGEVNLDNYEVERISDEYYWEMCLLQGELYGVEREEFRIKKLNF